MKINNKQEVFTFVTVVSVLTVIACWRIFSIGRVSLNSGEIFSLTEVNSDKDSVMLDDRHMGYINWEKFKTLMSRAGISASDIDENFSKDSVLIRYNKLNAYKFFGRDNGEWWISRYRSSLPIAIHDGEFHAAIKVIDTVKYVHIPYQILASMASCVDNLKQTDYFSEDTIQRETINRNFLPVARETHGTKIQVEGYVRKNVFDILSNYPQYDGHQREQLSLVWKFVKDHWYYVNDPAGTEDTWRSASETIEDYYFVNGRQYTGDCDDFAILMASFARQLGFDSKVVAAIREGEQTGHAYAMFYDENNKSWVPMDWFDSRFGGKPYAGTIIREYRDL